MLDGGLATELERHGADLDDPLWSGRVLIESPELVEQVSYDYFAAGADVGVSASYQLTMPGLMAKGFTATQAESTLRESIAVVQRAAARADRSGLSIAASIGPYGAYLHDRSEYTGDYRLSHRELKDFHRDRLAILADCEPDIIAFETIPQLAEAVALAELLMDFPSLSAWLSFSCRDGSHIADGTPLRQAVAALADSKQIAAVGVNCMAPEFADELLAEASAATEKPLVVYPNGSGCNLAEAAIGWHRLGARLIGGCCGTTPDTIRSMRAALS